MTEDRRGWWWALPWIALVAVVYAADITRCRLGWHDWWPACNVHARRHRWVCTRCGRVRG